MGGSNFSVISESVQMYLVTIIRLRVGNQPVPLSLLADSLSISPVSVNEMCRKLQDQGLVVYRPYKGASLTEKGEQQACFILRRHRLWEVFLVDKLDYSYEEAHEIACILEHATPNHLADRLDGFLEYPAVNFVGELIPRSDGQPPTRPAISLAALSPGQQGRVIRCELEGAPQSFLAEHGISPGVWVQVVAMAGEGVLIQAGKIHVSLVQSLAEAIQVEPGSSIDKPDEILPVEQSFENETNPIKVQEIKEVIKMRDNEQAAVQHVPLNKLNVGQRGIVVSVGSKGPVKRRMMDMGLVPGSEVSVLRVAPLGDPIEFRVKGYSLSLRKSEAKDIIVEVVR
ncbi:MAG: FeoA domain-containing protein [Anaerolineaceae bacterium]|nr:FeoA domain-containing protein [Anaerolineaceae bacterium]